jgi:hypothetical protein
VFDAGPNELRFYNPYGQFLRKVGGSGEGPGEFRLVLGSGDRIFIYDSSLRRLTELNGNGEVGSIFRVPDQPEGSSILHPVGPADDRTYVWSSFRTPPCVANTVVTDTLTYWSVDVLESPSPDGDVLVPVANAVGGRRWSNTINVTQMCLPNPIPFVRAPIARVRLGALYVSLPDALAVRVVHLGEGTESMFRGSADRKALSAELVDSWIDETINTTARDEGGNALNTAGGMQLYARRLRAMPYPDSLPVTDQFVVDGSCMTSRP